MQPSMYVRMSVTLSVCMYGNIFTIHFRTKIKKWKRGLDYNVLIAGTINTGKDCKYNSINMLIVAM